MDKYFCSGDFVACADEVFASGDGGSCPIKEGGDFIKRGVDAAMTHGVAEVVVPVSAVDRVSFIEKHVVRDVWEIIVST